MKTATYLFALLGSLLLSRCQPPPVYFFDADPYVKAYQETFNEPLTVVLGKDIENDFAVGDMEVHQFRKSLRITMYYMFEETFTDIQFADQVSPEGYTLQLYRLRPSWQVASSVTDVIGAGDVVVSTSSTRQIVSIRYDGAIYRKNEKIAILDDAVISQLQTFDRKEKPSVFRDGVRELCEVLYKDLLKTKLQSVRIAD